VAEAREPVAAESEPSATAAAVTPFWQRMPRLFLFPLQRAPLVRIVLASVASVLAVSLLAGQFAAAPWRTLLLLLLAGTAANLYVAQFAFLVIERTASGYLDSRSYPRSGERADWRRPLKMFLILVAVPVLLALSGALLPGALVLAAMLAFVLLLPASVMVLTMTDSFSEAIHPGRCAGAAWRIGPPYLLLCLYLFLLFTGFQQALHVVLPVSGAGAVAAASAAHAVAPAARAPASALSFGIAYFAVSVVGNYFLVLTCALIGYVMYQYGDALGVSVVGPGEAAVRGPMSASAHARRQREALIGKMVAAGEFREAIDLVREEMSARPGDLSLHARMHTLLLHEGSRPRIEEHAQRYLERLLVAGNVKDALALLEQTRAAFADFGPRDPGRLPQLAAAALDADKPRLAADVVRGFDSRNPGHPAIPDVFVIGARIYLQTGQSDTARRLLQLVVDRFPDAAAAAEARRYLERFAGSAAGFSRAACPGGSAASPAAPGLPPDPAPGAPASDGSR
jgi:hypothetical protein